MSSEVTKPKIEPSSSNKSYKFLVRLSGLEFKFRLYGTSTLENLLESVRSWSVQPDSYFRYDSYYIKPSMTPLMIGASSVDATDPNRFSQYNGIDRDGEAVNIIQGFTFKPENEILINVTFTGFSIFIKVLKTPTINSIYSSFTTFLSLFENYVGTLDQVGIIKSSAFNKTVTELKIQNNDTLELLKHNDVSCIRHVLHTDPTESKPMINSPPIANNALRPPQFLQPGKLSSNNVHKNSLENQKHNLTQLKRSINKISVAKPLTIKSQTIKDPISKSLTSKPSIKQTNVNKVTTNKPMKIKQRRSCDMCRQKKRGCDRLEPSCSGCLKRKIPCIFDFS